MDLTHRKSGRTLLVSCLMGTLLSISCTHDGRPGTDGWTDRELHPDDEIAFTVTDVASKVTPVTTANLSSFNVVATVYNEDIDGDEQYFSATASKSGSRFYTGMYWATSDPGITAFYASNATITDMCAVMGDNDTDIVVAANTAPSYKTVNSLTFSHVLARVGTVTVNTQTGYELSNVSATLSGVASAGLYSFSTGTWTPSGDLGDIALASFSGSTAAQSSVNDICVIPGTYSMEVSYRLTKDGSYQDITRTSVVTLEAGDLNGITLTAVGGR